jgi:Ribonuclease G/E
MMDTYQTKFTAFKEGKLSEKAWRKYCEKILHEIMIENKDVFERMKNK